MATADEIGAGFSNYRGDAGLAAGSFGVIDVDTRPLQNLAAYTMLYNKEVWKQKQQETDAKITQLADLSNIALNDLREKDKVQATKEFAELQKYASEYARKIPRTPQERMQNELEWQTKYGAFKNNYNSGKDRAVTYQKRYNDIVKGTQDAKAKDVQIKLLNEEFNRTDIGTKISGEAAYKTSVVEVPDPTLQKFQSVIIGGNENLLVDGSVYNPKTNAGMADAAILGVQKIYPKQGTAAYESLSELEKNQAAIQSTLDSGSKVWVDATQPLNVALKPYINADGIFDAVSFENDNASNTTVMNAYNALKRYDSYNRSKYEQAKSGMFNDKGLSVKLPENLNPEDFKVGFVDFSKGVNANQLVQSGMFAKYGGDTFGKKVTETDNAIQMATLHETIRNNKADQYLKGRELKSNEDKWKAAQTGGTTQVNGAMERAKRIYGDLLKIADKNGIISPNNIRKLNVEQLKYLGIEVPQERDPTTGVITSQGGFKPLDLTKEDYGIQLVDGKVNVYGAKKKNDGTIEENLRVLPDGRLVGHIDNTKSTTLFNIGTNILNEELKNAGSKELNTYYGVDVSGQITTNTQGGTTTVSGTTKQTDVNSLDPNGFKKEGKNYRYKDGTLYDAKGNIVK